MPKVADIIRIIDQMAPRRLAEEWDNVGLHFGNPDWPVSTIFVSLDPTVQAVEAAAAAGADMLVTHHPLIFKPLKQINTGSPAGAVIDFAARNRIAVFCAHTNLDAAAGGINDVLAEKIGMKVTGPLSYVPEAQRYKVVVFAPPSDVDPIFEAISDTSAGRIGQYTRCAFCSEGVGQFVPDPESRPHTGAPGRLSRADEIRIEIPVDVEDLDTVINRIKNRHSYETPAYDVYPLYREKSAKGIGRIGAFEEARPLLQLAGDIKAALSLKMVKIAGPPDLLVKTGAVCSGGGGGMVGDFLSAEAQVYISGDLNHHAALDIAAKNRGLVDIGHFASEQLYVPVLCSRIREALNKKSMGVDVIPWKEEPDPFEYV